jgi:two-component system sensor histidine kinase KdpD
VIGLAIPEGRLWTRADDNLLQSLGRTLALSVERFRSESRSRKAVLQLESERLGGILLDSVSHELRTPLTTITGSLSALRDDALAEKAEPRHAILTNALEAADRLDDVVEDLLGLQPDGVGHARPQPPSRRPERPGAGRRRSSRAGARLARNGYIDSHRKEAPAMVDPALSARLAANLLRNAARYSPPGTPIEFSLEATKGELAIRVRDRGPGNTRTSSPRSSPSSSEAATPPAPASGWDSPYAGA